MSFIFFAIPKHSLSCRTELWVLVLMMEGTREGFEVAGLGSISTLGEEE